ncbi:hypothetical protein Nepgr_028944 [Nepenthes gracilis]|uniref:Uncharacterized protein n=1 Tax=Nepenthes gracilis TaxID=150966 RepID=A0AAD3TDE2_NEPGR|nr:hypothetical protein Nepgr_028944 [Nepenthes gracilis]
MSPSDATGLMDCKFSGDILLPDGAVGALRIDQACMLAASMSSSPPVAHLQGAVNASPRVSSTEIALAYTGFVVAILVRIRMFELMPLPLFTADSIIGVLVARVSMILSAMEACWYALCFPPEELCCAGNWLAVELAKASLPCILWCSLPMLKLFDDMLDLMRRGGHACCSDVRPADGGEGCLVLCFVSWSCAPGYGRTVVVGYRLLEVEEVGGGTAMPFRCWQELLPSYFLQRDASNLSSLECDYQSRDFGVGS